MWEKKINIFYKLFFYALREAFLKLYFNFELTLILNYLRNTFILNKLLIAITLENPVGTGLPVRVYNVGKQNLHLI